MKKIKFISKVNFFITVLTGIIFFSCVKSDNVKTMKNDSGYQMRTLGLTVSLSGEGEITSIAVNGKKYEKPVHAFTSIEGCRQDGKTVSTIANDGSVRFEKKLVDDSLKKACTLIEQFIPTETGVRWELLVKGDGEPWGSVIQTRIHYPAEKNTLFWTAWGAPQYDPSTVDKPMAERLKAHRGGSGIDFSNYDPRDRPASLNEKNDCWIDPLIAVPFSDATYYYGAPGFGYEREKRKIGYIPYDNDIFCIPFATVIEPEHGVGLTFALSPAEEIIDLKMDVSAKGDIVFNRLFNRISSAKDCLFSMDITEHADDWRPALAWMSARYPEYFNPVNPKAHILGGTGAYSNHWGDFDVEKMKKMCFTVNWQASFDFPYMGMFLPPVDRNEPWPRFGGNSTITINDMANYAADMKAKGFYVLNYFNVTEFGTKIKYPPSALKITNEKERWKNSNEFLYAMFPNAILGRPNACVTNPKYINATPPEPWFSWEESIVMDCGDPAYRDFLLEQARRHVAEIPDAAGICIDRMDWLRMFNEAADDSITWFEGKPARSLITSWKRLMEDLGPIFHTNDKFILVNNHVKRIDFLKQVDGIFDEFTYAGVPLNTTAFLCIDKPALGWTDDAATVKNEGGDAFFQKYLYMGVFPMCPFPGNNHSIRPDAEVDQIYLDYGPLMKLMQSRQWVLSPHAVSVENNLAKANIFKIPEGYSVPVVYGEADKVCVKIANIEGLSKQTTCVAYYPGKETPVELKMSKTGNIWSVGVPLEKGCAMLKLTTQSL